MELELDEVIENLEYLVSDSCTDTQFDYVEEIEIATKSFKKQIPKKVQEKRIYMSFLWRRKQWMR